MSIKLFFCALLGYPLGFSMKNYSTEFIPDPAADALMEKCRYFCKKQTTLTYQDCEDRFYYIWDAAKSSGIVMANYIVGKEIDIFKNQS